MILEGKEEQKHFFNYEAGVDSFVKAIWILWNVKFARPTHKSAVFCNKARTSPVKRLAVNLWRRVESGI